jgi:hypothetical protein
VVLVVDGGRSRSGDGCGEKKEKSEWTSLLGSAYVTIVRAQQASTIEWTANSQAIRPHSGFTKLFEARSFSLDYTDCPT